MLPPDDGAVDSVVASIEDNLCAYAAFLGATSGAQLHMHANVLWVISRIPTLPFTGILRPYPPAAALPATVTSTMDFFHQQQARPSWIFSPQRCSPDLVAYLGQYHLTETANLPGMALNLSLLQPVDLPPFHVTSVTDRELLARWVGIYAESNGAPDWIATELLALFGATDYCSAGPLRLYLGWQADQPVATAATFGHADSVGLYEVATLPAFRRQGIGTSITVQALNEARQQGYTLATLVSSSLAEQLYRKLGFTDYCRLVIYN